MAALTVADRPRPTLAPRFAPLGSPGRANFSSAHQSYYRVPADRSRARTYERTAGGTSTDRRDQSIRYRKEPTAVERCRGVRDASGVAAGGTRFQLGVDVASLSSSQLSNTVAIFWPRRIPTEWTSAAATAPAAQPARRGSARPSRFPISAFSPVSLSHSSWSMHQSTPRPTRPLSISHSI